MVLRETYAHSILSRSQIYDYAINPYVGCQHGCAAGRGGQTGDVHWDARDELRLLVTHGTLHVCGWDHAKPAGEAGMRGLERRLLAGA